MKQLLLIFTLLISLHAFTQNNQQSDVNNQNYYSFYQNTSGHSINWLRASDAIPVIIDELIKNNIPYYTITVGKLLKINDSSRLVITVAFDKGNKEYGFVYEASHGIPLTKKDRDFLTDKSKAYYIQSESTTENEVDFMRIEPLPENIFLLKQRCYWFQFDENGTKYTVDKLMAEKILRQDIQFYLSKL